MPEPGTTILYQGRPCSSVVFRRSRGFGADVSEVVLPVAPGFPAGFKWEPDPAALAGALATSTAEGEPSPDAPLVLPVGLEPEGTLILRQRGVPQGIAAAGLIVLRAETDLADAHGQFAFLKLTLVDWRYFGSLGRMERWSFNRLRGDGSLAADSLKGAEDPYDWDTLLRLEVAPYLLRAPAVAHVPESWQERTGELQLAPWESPIRGLGEMIRQANAVEPCLHLDGALAIYGYGDAGPEVLAPGVLSYAPGGVGVNSTPVPPQFLLDEEGKGLVHAVEAGYPPPALFVVGEPTVATVALDDWEPVLLIRGEVYLLSEELVLTLTGKRYGLEWLKSFLLLPAADQASVDLGQVELAERQGAIVAEGSEREPRSHTLTPGEVLRILAEQAGRLYRLPGVELAQDGFYTGEPGPNAHLLPILARAETSGGRRLPALVESYSWRTVRKHLRRGSAASKAMDKLQIVYDALQKQAGFLRIGNVLGGKARLRRSGTFEDVGFVGSDQFLRGNADGPPANKAAIDRGKLSSYLDKARRVDQATEDGLAGGRYEQALVESLRAQDAEDGGDREAHYKLARELVNVEKQIKEAVGRNLLGGGEDQAGEDRILEPFRDLIKGIVEAGAAEIASRLEQQFADERTGVKRQAEGETYAIALQNMPRTPDPGAVVLDAETGLVRTSELAVHVDNEDVPTPALARAVFMPVRVRFGATLRPRTDLAPGQAPRRPGDETRTRGDAEGSPAPPIGPAGGENLVPEALSDQETFFAAAFKRTGKGQAERVGASPPPKDALRVARPWRRLQPLEGEGNLAQLERDAEAFAREAFDRPDTLTTTLHQLAGPWPVQCDGVVESIEIRSDEEGGVPCGFTTTVRVGSYQESADDGRTRERRRSPDNARDHLLREGIA